MAKMLLRYFEVYTIRKVLIRGKEVQSLPIEYYEVKWYGFNWDNATSRLIPLKVALIDSDNGKLPNGSDIYISRIIKDNLDTDDVVKITQAFRGLQDDFSGNQSVKDINDGIKGSSAITNKEIEADPKGLVSFLYRVS